MRNRSLLSSVGLFFISVLGLISHFFAIQSESFTTIILVVVLYLTPLVIDVIEDFEHVTAYNSSQYTIDILAMISGILYLFFLGSAIVLKAKGVDLFSQIPAEVQGYVSFGLKIVMMISPALFMLKKFYALRIVYSQSRNTARGYFNRPKSIHSANVGQGEKS